MHGQQNIKIKE